MTLSRFQILNMKGHEGYFVQITDESGCKFNGSVLCESYNLRAFLKFNESEPPQCLFFVGYARDI